MSASAVRGGWRSPHEHGRLKAIPSEASAWLGLPFTILVVGLAAGPYTRPGLLVIARSCLAPWPGISQQLVTM